MTQPPPPQGIAVMAPVGAMLPPVLESETAFGLVQVGAGVGLEWL